MTTIDEIAGQLGLGVRTVEHHRNNVAVKLELRGSHALTKFALGTYGICEDCGRPIPAARLKALPMATLDAE